MAREGYAPWNQLRREGSASSLECSVTCVQHSCPPSPPVSCAWCSLRRVGRLEDTGQITSDENQLEERLRDQLVFQHFQRFAIDQAQPIVSSSSLVLPTRVRQRSVTYESGLASWSVDGGKAVTEASLNRTSNDPSESNLCLRAAPGLRGWVEYTLDWYSRFYHCTTRSSNSASLHPQPQWPFQGRLSLRVPDSWISDVRA